MLQPYFLAKNRTFSSLFNLQSKSINFNVGHLSAKCQGYSLTFWPNIAQLHHFSICNQNQSISMLVRFRQNTKVIDLLFGQKSLSFITFQSAIKINQFQFWSFFGKIPRLQPYFLATNRSFFYNLSICYQNQSISMLVSCQQNTNVIALLFGQKSLIFITSQSAITINQFQCSSFFGKIPRLQPYFLAKNRSFSSLVNMQSKSINFNVGQLSAKYECYSLTSWPKIAHFHHFSICNQNQSISMLVSFRRNTKVIALLFGQKSHIVITFQSAIKINQFQCWSSFGKIPRLQPYFLAKNRSFSSLLNLQSKSFNFNVGHLSAKYQGYSLTVWPKIAHFFIMFQSAIKINQFQCWSVFGKIPRLQPYFLAKNRSFSSLFNLQSKSINFNVGHCSAKYQGYSLTFWPQIAHFFIIFQSAIKINQFQCWSVVSKIRMLQPYFLAKNRSFSSLFNLQSKSINFNIGQFSVKYQGYSLTFWPKLAHVHHFSICNQNHSIAMLVICRQNTKGFALLFGQKSLIFITFQSAIKINQF